MFSPLLVLERYFPIIYDVRRKMIEILFGFLIPLLLTSRNVTSDSWCVLPIHLFHRTWSMPDFTSR